MNFTILIIGSYLLGSVPFAMIIAKCHGKDLRNIGSGNIGTTNLSRACGKKWAYLCFTLDAAKGMVPMLIAKMLISNLNPASLLIWFVVGFAAVMGHIFPVYLKFNGGKGAATSFGVAVGLWPYYSIGAAAALVTWITVVSITRYVSLASITGSIVFPITLIVAVIFYPDWTFADLWPLLIAATLIPVTVTMSHRENIKRLLAGTENKVRKKNETHLPHEPS